MSSAPTLTLTVLLIAAPWAWALDAESPVLASFTSVGAAAVGACTVPRFDHGNARYLSFNCADPLVPEDNNMRVDSYLVDRHTGTVERVSINTQGEEVPFDSGGGVPSIDGRKVAFQSLGVLHPDALVPPFVTISNVYVRDRLLSETKFVSRDIIGELSQFSVSIQDALPHRAEVLLLTRSPLLEPGLPTASGQLNLYLRNWQSGQIELVSQQAAGGISNGISAAGRLSTDGRLVLFTSTATDLPGAPSSGANLYVHDRLGGTTLRLTRPWHGGEFIKPLVLDGHPARISTDGRWVVFASNSPEFIPDDDPEPLPQSQVYLLDRSSSTFERISIGKGDQAGNAYSGVADISDDARYVAFFSRAGNFPAGGSAIYVVDRLTGAWANVTAPLGPLVGVSTSPRLDLARDGSVIAFSWRSADPDSPYFDRSLIFTVELRGKVPPKARAVPLPFAALALVLGLLLLGRSALRARTRS